MVRKTEEERLADLEAKRLHIEQQMRSIVARQKVRSRKNDTRRKVLVGAAILAEAEKNSAAMQRLMMLLDQYLVRDIDRAVFDLSPKAEPAKPT